MSKGWKHSEETKKYFSLSRKGDGNSFFGKHHSEESKRKMSEKLKGRICSEESKEKLRQARKGRTPAKGFKHSEETKKKYSETRRGELHPNWKGGRKVNKEGYVFIKMPSHPCADSNGYILEHRLIVEKVLGRHLKTEEEVHHINNNHGDNRNENMLICKKNYHSYLHGKMNSNLTKYKERPKEVKQV